MEMRIKTEPVWFTYNQSVVENYFLKILTLLISGVLWSLLAYCIDKEGFNAETMMAGLLLFVVCYAVVDGIVSLIWRIVKAAEKRIRKEKTVMRDSTDESYVELQEDRVIVKMPGLLSFEWLENNAFQSITIGRKKVQIMFTKSLGVVFFTAGEGNPSQEEIVDYIRTNYAGKCKRFVNKVRAR